MSELSIPTNNLPSAAAGQWAEQMQESIQSFLNWIDSVEIHSSQVSQSRQADNKTARRNAAFTNGPYAEIKESIGRLK